MNKEDLKKLIENNMKLEKLKEFIDEEFNSGLNEFDKTDVKQQAKLSYWNGRLSALKDIKDFLKN